jgi:hypothetical protein
LNFDDKYKSYQEKTYQTHAPNMGRLEESICKVVRSNNYKDTSVLFPFWALWCENSPPKKNPDGCSSIERTSIL